MGKPERFLIKDCAITILALGRSAQNLREFRDGIATVPLQSISHHFLESLLRPAFDDPEYRNDYALWARRHLRDDELAERLGSVDPLSFASLEDLRQYVLDIVEDRLAGSLHVPSASPGHEFHFLSSRMVVLDTGMAAETPAALSGLIRSIPRGSVFFHFVEARRRPPLARDDLSAWLERWGPEYDRWRQAIAAIDFQLWSLTEMRSLLAECMAIPPAVGRRKP